MRKKVGLILIVIAIAGLILSLTVRMVEPECCSYYAGIKPGSGLSFAAAYKFGLVSIACSCAAGYPPLPHYWIIPVDFIILSILVGWVGVGLYKAKRRAEIISKPQAG